MTIWDGIYRSYLDGGPAWASLKDDLHPMFLEFIKGASFPRRNALDIGCGEGKYLSFLQTLGFQTTGLDSSTTAIALSRRMTKDRGALVLADMYEYAYPADSYGLVVSHATLHHGPKSKVIALLARIREALVEGGSVFISLPSEDCKHDWAMMASHDMLEDGTCVPRIGPERGLPHSFFSRDEVSAAFSGGYVNLKVDMDDRGRWTITGRKGTGGK